MDEPLIEQTSRFSDLAIAQRGIDQHFLEQVALCMAATDSPDIIPHRRKLAGRSRMVTALSGQDGQRQRQPRITGYRRLAFVFSRRVAGQGFGEALRLIRTSGSGQASR